MASLTPRLDRLERNLCINGNFDFWQRGTTLNFQTARLYIADRFCHVRSSGYSGNSVASRSTDVPTVAQSGFKSNYSLLVTNGTGLASPGASDFHLPIMYLIEGNDYVNLHGQKGRIQFWMKASIAGTYSVAVRNNDGTRSYVTTVAVALANTWEKKTIDLTFDSTGTWAFDNTNALSLSICGGVGATFTTSTLNTWQSGNYMGANTQTNWAGTTSATIQVSQFMIIPGDFSGTDVEIPFQRCGRTIQDELAMCQRYYYQFSDFNAGTRPIARAIWYDSGALYFTIRLPVTMRGDPVLVGTAGTDIVVYTVALAVQTGFGATVTTNPTRDNVYIACSKGAHGLTDGVLATTTNTTGLSAEL
jgi:hypothetical protein